MIDTLWQVTPSFQLSTEMDGEIEPTPYVVHGDVAIISLIGPTSKYGMHGTMSTVKIRQQLQQAVSDPDVQAILLRIDSPGGQAAGNHELVADVREFNKIKPIHAYTSDMMASAAYAVASQASRITANEHAMVGSIGTMSALVDTSGMASAMGLKVHPLTSGGVKGLGQFGVPVTAEEVGYAQSLLDKVNDKLIDTVAAGRNMDRNQAAQLADGRVHIAADAVQLGLIDSTGSFEEAVSNLQSLLDQRNSTMSSFYPNNGAMSPLMTAAPNPAQQAPAQAAPPAAPTQQQTAAPAQTNAPAAARPATIEELKQACPGAPAEFILQCVEANATVTEAQSAYIGELTRQEQAAPPQALAQSVAPQAPAPTPAAAPAAPAVQTQTVPVAPAAPSQPLPATMTVPQIPGQNAVPEPESAQSAGGGSAQDDWHMAVQREKQNLMNLALLHGKQLDPFELTRQATVNADNNNPGLRERYVKELNGSN